MYTIEGLTETEVVKVIDSIVNQIAPSYVFGFYTLDDIKQEGRIFGLEGLPKFIVDKGEASIERNQLTDRLYNFLRSHITYRFVNLIRDNFERAEPPNCECKYCKRGERDKCKRYQSFVNRNVAKKTMASPAQEPSQEQYSSVTHEIESRELVEVFNQHLPPYLRGDFKRMLENVKIPATRKQKIKDILTDIVQSGVYGQT